MDIFGCILAVIIGFVGLWQFTIVEYADIKSSDDHAKSKLKAVGIVLIIVAFGVLANSWPGLLPYGD